MGKLRRLSGFLFVCALALLSGVATLARAQSLEAREVDIPAQSLDTALRQLANALSLQILFLPEDVKGMTTRGVKGRYAPQEAAERLIEGTGLAAVFNGKNAITIKPTAGSRAQNPTPLAQAQIEKDRASASDFKATENIVVTGTRIQGAREGPLEMRSYDRAQIENSGQPSLTRFLNTLPQVSQISLGAAFGAQSTIQLRGFPVGTTLVLLDGHHAPNSGLGTGNAFNIDNIPPGLLQRVDVLPLGSSAIYGSDALAGVVNFILRRDLDGGSASFAYGNASSYDDFNVTASYGHRFDRGDFGLGVTYENHGLLTVQDRPFAASGDFTRFAAIGGRDARNAASCLPGTVSVNSGSLPGLNGSFAAIPTNVAGRPAVSAFAAGVGIRNLCNPIGTDALIADQWRASALAYGDWDFGAGLNAYGTVLYGHSAAQIPLNVIALTNTTLPAANAFNPFGTAVIVNTGLPIIGKFSNTYDFVYADGGLRGDLFRSWTWDLNGHFTEDRDRILNAGQRITGLFNSALASSDPAVAVNLFSTDPGSPALQNVVKTSESHFRGKGTTARILLNGPVISLPAGAVQAAIGGQYERLNFVSAPGNFDQATGAPTVTRTDSSRNIESAFGELRAPLVSSLVNDNLPFLAVSAAVRTDRFSDFGTATTPQFAAELRPARGLLLKGSYSEAFRAPLLSSLYGARTNVQQNVIDPLRGNVTVSIPTLSGGNPDIKPETGRSRSIGAMWTAGPNVGLTASATYWEIKEADRIATLSAAAIVLAVAGEPGLFPGRVVRDAAGNITLVDRRSLNFGELDAHGIDVDVVYKLATPYGEFTPSASLAMTTKFKAAIVPGAPPVSRLDTPLLADAWAPKYKATARLGWNFDAYSATITGRYLGRYLDYQTPVNTNHLGDYWLWDAALKVKVGTLFDWPHPLGKHTELSITAVNLLNRGPQYSNYGSGAIGYDQLQYDILGRFISVRLATNW